MLSLVCKLIIPQKNCNDNNMYYSVLQNTVHVEVCARGIPSLVCKLIIPQNTVMIIIFIITKHYM